MTVHVHTLAGITPSPLAHYLDALGILRLVAEQADPSARGFFRNDIFHLATTLDADGIRKFFLERYAPTPLVSPWNGGSGFYPKDTKDGIDAIAKGNATRFAPYRQAIEAARRVVGERKESPKDKDAKLYLLRECRRAWSGGALAWLDAAAVLTDEGAQYPALLGTGGNDGRLDFTNNQMQRLIELFDPNTGAPSSNAASLLDAALFGVASPGYLRDRAIGQFLPGGAGGVNSAAGFSGKSIFNPWDFVWMLEGALLFQVAAVRRLDSVGLAQAAAPFAMRAQAGGYASACGADESARGEQWMPVWDRPSSLGEVRALLAEGRLQVRDKRAQSALDAARAIARLGAARGVTAFYRYGYIERNGLANFAVPLGHFPVHDIPTTKLLDEIDAWVDSLRRASRGSGAPASLGRTVRRIESAMFEVCKGTTPAKAFQELLIRLGQAEDELVRRPKFTAEARLQPLPALSFDWANAANDASDEFKIALAIASQRTPGDDKRGEKHRLGSIRTHCLPLDPKLTRFAEGSDSLQHDPRVVWKGRNLLDDLGAIVLRRIIDARKQGIKSFPLQGQAFASLDAIAAFLDGCLDESSIAGLCRPLMAISCFPDPTPVRSSFNAVSALHAIFRVAHLPHEVLSLTVPTDPEPSRLLLAGRLFDATRVALNRLSSSGLRPKLHMGMGGPELAKRLVASLVIPVSLPDLEQLVRFLSKPIQYLEKNGLHHGGADAPAHK